MHTTLTLF